ncbi:hypothetical protein [Halegenticoccus soli]|nr:hypothetical protein [Halegenticoccus soli]
MLPLQFGSVPVGPEILVILLVALLIGIPLLYVGSQFVAGLKGN